MYVLFGIYLLNLPLGFFDIPGNLEEYEEWIFLISGILLFIGGINFLRIGLRKARISKAKKE